jgi:hypothetical protein
MNSRIRRALIALALAAIGIAGALWLFDGAWHYGAMPDKGLIRTALFGGAACVCFLIAGRLSEKR